MLMLMLMLMISLHIDDHKMIVDSRPSRENHLWLSFYDVAHTNILECIFMYQLCSFLIVLFHILYFMDILLAKKC